MINSYFWPDNFITIEKKDFNEYISSENKDVFDLDFITVNSKSNKMSRYKINQIFDPVNKYISSQVFSLGIPKRWISESIIPPNLDCKKLTERVALQLYKTYLLIPKRIGASIEEGVLLFYQNFNNNNELSIEIYNDLDIAAIITNDNNIISVKDIYDENFSEIISIFNKQ